MQYPVANKVLDISSIRVTGAWCSHVCGFLIIMHPLQQCFSTFVGLWPGKFLFYKTRARSEQIYL